MTPIDIIGIGIIAVVSLGFVIVAGIAATHPRSGYQPTSYQAEPVIDEETKRILRNPPSGGSSVSWPRQTS